MTDIHSHILFDIDDGASSIEESLLLLRKMREVGFDNIILTPHYIDDSKYNINNKKKLSKFKLLVDKVKDNNIDINLYLGNEVFINNDINLLIEKEKILTLNNSNYVLLELPFNNKIINLENKINEIKMSGLDVIIAHPERYIYFQNDYSLVNSLRKKNVLFQCNYSSLMGNYGNRAKRLFKYMLKNKYIDYLGTDIHNINNTYVLNNFSKIEKKIIRLGGQLYYDEIKNNCDLLINNKTEIMGENQK